MQYLKQTNKHTHKPNAFTCKSCLLEYDTMPAGGAVVCI